ncbi:MAG: TPM domain-containing protein [Proteobacteria bacterium]|nr:TPM domain-containing protein [Pseudomonadota bacterium]
MLNEDEQARINAAIAQAERATSGEVFCILAQRSSSYAETPLAYAGFASLLVPLAMVAAGLEPWHWAQGWSVRAPGPEAAVFTYALLQAGVFLLTLGVTAWRPLRMLLAPHPLKRARVHKLALQQFLAKGLHVTTARTGVLILASADERHAEIVADEGVYARVSPEVWAEALESLIARMKQGDTAGGFIEAVRLCGEVLAQHFPPSAENPNELPDTVLLI